jgi:UPF0755 protein
MTTDINPFQRPTTPKEPLSPVTEPTPDRPEEPVTQSSKWGKRLLIAAAVLIFLGIAVIAGLYGWYQYQLQPVSSKEQAIEFIIAPGNGAVTIGDQLEDKKLIRSSLAFQLYLRQRGDSGNIHAGTYLLSPSLSVREVTDVLIDGKVAQQKITIPPGLRLDQIVDKLEQEGYSKLDTEAALEKAAKTQLQDIKPPEASLEGYIHPETYLMPLDASVDDIIAQATKQFELDLTDEVKDGLEEQGLTIHQGVILASITQKESSAPDTQKQIAQVFLKRLDEGMMLGSDVTFLYAAAIAGVEPTIDIDSPYNTRINTGLPPGPIANFNSAAIEAIADPAEGDYLFFVAGDNGKVYFSKTAAQHQEYVDKYCIELCKL